MITRLARHSLTSLNQSLQYPSNVGPGIIAISPGHQTNLATKHVHRQTRKSVPDNKVHSYITASSEDRHTHNIAQAITESRPRPGLK